MTEAVIVALISAAVTLAGVLLANARSQAVMQEQISEMKADIKEHNGYAKHMPAIEERVNAIDKRLERLENRMEAE